MRSRLSGPGSFRVLGWIAAVALSGPGFLRAAGVKSDERPPNLIVIMADDLGAKELSCYGSPEHHTPNLDRLGRTGVEFATCYSAPICHPTRFEIMTGLRQNTILFFTGDNGTGGQGKGQPTELGARVPMIVNGPGLVKPVGLCDELVDLSDVLPTLAELAGADLPNDRPIDGRSFAFLLEGKPGEPRDWIFSYLGDRRILRTKRWLLEDNSPHHYGRLYDCGTSRDGAGYQEVTDSTDPEVLAIKKTFEEILATKPAPMLPTDGPLNPQPVKKKPKKADKNK
ncbi:MAG: sulfatase-like hydrolase/transferase [Planctomycetota bacterium]